MTRYSHFKQTPVFKTKIGWIISQPIFFEGVKDARAGAPMREGLDRRDAWMYERGRLLGLLYKGPILNRQRGPNPKAIAAYRRHRAANEII